MEFTEVISRRHSSRRYKDIPLEDEKLQEILAAGNAAPVGRSLYKSMHITVVRNKQILDKIREASMAAVKFDLLHGANTFIVLSSDGDPLLPNIEYSNAACIIENMLLAATNLGVGSCYLFGVANVINGSEELRSLLDIKDGFRAVSGVILGYADEKKEKIKDLSTYKMEISYI